jgi:hypothetical protein
VLRKIVEALFADMTGKRTSVQIDDRLTELFTSRRIQTAEVVDESAQSGDPSAPFDASWLSEFQSQAKPLRYQSEMDGSVEQDTSIYVDRRDVRPFWAPEDMGSAVSLWKKSKSWLAQDCQKQRKAALRKTIHRKAA